ncbi:uncharacterized protein LOC135157047 [Lytechinus pictus]|uniref:uncharacterized protein LOC135157047 n=1 Tax=Lytechinus pictus TaxID=7653 RepID=UPI0030BA1326
MPKVKPGKKLSQRKSTRRSVRDAASQPSPVDLETDVGQVFTSTQSPAAGSSASTTNDGQVSQVSTRRRSGWQQASRPSLEQLHIEREHLLFSSRAPGTHHTYRNAWSVFKQFRLQYHYDLSIRPDVEQVAQFIAYLSWNGYAGATISTYISGLAFTMQTLGWPDVTDAFVIRRLVDGCRRKNARRDTRCPITLPILKSILNSLTHVCVNTYDLALFRAAFLIAFFGFLRVGEFTSRSRHEPVPLSEKDVIIQGMGNQAKLRIVIARSKTDQTGRGCSILIPQNVVSYLCPLRAVNDYLALRSSVGSAFFRHFDSSPLTRHQFGQVLKRAISFCGLPVAHFSSHSFRIGAATSAAMAGVPDVCIQNMGRWASNTHRLYIRQPLPP